jgi:hypothetical protein
MVVVIYTLGLQIAGGAEGIRTPYLRDANAALSQMSYSPMQTLRIITHYFLVSQQHYCYTESVP